MAEPMAIGVALAMAGTVAGGAIGSWLWANAVARKHPSRFYYPARWLPRIGTILLIACVLVTIVGLVRSFGAVANADSASKATELARGISMAMNYGAAPGALAVLCLALSGSISLAGTLQEGTSKEGVS